MYIFLEQIMKYILKNHKSTISFGGREISDLRFVDDIYLIACSNAELQELKNRLVEFQKYMGWKYAKKKYNNGKQ